MKKVLVVIIAFLLCFGFVSTTSAVSSPIASGIQRYGKALTSTDGLNLYDVVTFGNYPQSTYGDSAEIEWYVIGINGNKVRLLSRYALDSRQYHDRNSTVTWQGSTLYNWLNGTFKSTAFTAEEQQRLVGSVSLPSVSEAEGLPTYIRACQSTAYAIAQGANPNRCIWWLSSFSGTYEIYGDHYWWDYGWYYDTRAANCSSAVIETGEIYYAGFQVNYNGKTVRPTIVVDTGDSGASGASNQEQTTQQGTDSYGQSLVYKNNVAVTSTASLRVNDIVTFGSYPQNKYGDPASIEWIVISIDGNRAKLLSRYALDSRQYHDRNSTVTWQGSTLYNWLNNTFKSTAFTTEEQQMLSMPVSLPSVKEAQDMSNELRICQSTPYAIAQGANENRCIWWLSSFSGEYQIRTGWWWWSDTRSANCASAVKEDGSIAQSGYQVDYHGKTVRPMIVIGF